MFVFGQSQKRWAVHIFFFKMAAVEKARATILMKMDNVEAWLDASEEGDIEVNNPDEQLIIQVQSYPLI